MYMWELSDCGKAARDAWSNAASHGLTTILYSVADLPTLYSYLMITSTTYASRYGPLRFGLPSNRLQVCMYVYCMTIVTMTITITIFGDELMTS